MREEWALLSYDNEEGGIVVMSIGLIMVIVLSVLSIISVLLVQKKRD